MKNREKKGEKTLHEHDDPDPLPKGSHYGMVRENNTNIAILVLLFWFTQMSFSF